MRQVGLVSGSGHIVETIQGAWLIGTCQYSELQLYKSSSAAQTAQTVHSQL